MPPRLARLLGDFAWGTMEEVFADEIRQPAVTAELQAMAS
jgi:hypothetical protein